MTARDRPYWAGQEAPDATCGRVGLAGWCGEHCPVLHRGECPGEEEMMNALHDPGVAAFFAAHPPAPR